MNCFFGHKYSKWEIIKDEPIVRSKDNRKIGKGIELRRTCKRCNYINIKLKTISL